MSTAAYNRQNHELSESKIAERARQRWLAAGSPKGRDLDFWFQAERELRAQRQKDIPAWSMHRWGAEGG